MVFANLGEFNAINPKKLSECPEKYFVNDSIVIFTPSSNGLHPKKVDHVLSIIVIISFSLQSFTISLISITS